MNTLRQSGAAIRALIVLTIILGIIYPLVMVAVGYLIPAKANGSLQYNEGEVVGSSLIAHPAGGPEFFQPRPSAGDWDGANSGGNNLSPVSDAFTELQAEWEADLVAANPDAGPIPPEALTASSSGLDPHISPAYAQWQIPRVAAARGVNEEELRTLVDDHTRHAVLGFIGQDTVNVNELNYALEYE